MGIDGKSQTKKKLRRVIFKIGSVVLFVISALFIIARVYFPPEPTYQGRPLSEWLSDLDPITGNKARYEASALAINSFGEKAAPFLPRYLSFAKPSTLDAWILKIQEYVPIRTSPGPDVSIGALEAFRLLGPRAKFAIPDLVYLTNDQDSSVHAMWALSYIGREALPELIELLKSSNSRIKGEALFAIADLGPDAKPAIPILIRQASQAGANRGSAIRALGVIDPSTETRDLMRKLFWDTNYTFDAAFSLSRMGEIDLLKEASTNSDRTIRCAAIAGLDPAVTNAQIGRHVPDAHFSTLSCLYNLRALSAGFRDYATNNPAPAFLPDDVLPPMINDRAKENLNSPGIR